MNSANTENKLEIPAKNFVGKYSNFTRLDSLINNNSNINVFKTEHEQIEKKFESFLEITEAFLFIFPPPPFFLYTPYSSQATVCTMNLISVEHKILFALMQANGHGV